MFLEQQVINVNHNQILLQFILYYLFKHMLPFSLIMLLIILLIIMHINHLYKLITYLYPLIIIHVNNYKQFMRLIILNQYL